MLLDLVPLAGRCRWQCPPRPEPRRGRSAAGRHCHCHVEAPARRTFCWSIGHSGWQFAPRPRSDSESPIPASADPRAVCSGHSAGPGSEVTGGWVTWVTQARLVTGPAGARAI
jgi:hypothetical protein